MRAEDLINHSRALRTVGEVMMAQAKLDSAKVAFVRADAAARHAVSLAPNSTQSLAESGVAAYWLGYYYYRQARLEDARVHWTTYLPHQRTPAAPGPASSCLASRAVLRIEKSRHARARSRPYRLSDRIFQTLRRTQATRGGKQTRRHCAALRTDRYAVVDQQRRRIPGAADRRRLRLRHTDRHVAHAARSGA